MQVPSPEDGESGGMVWCVRVIKLLQGTGNPVHAFSNKEAFSVEVPD